MTVKLEINSNELKKLVIAHFRSKLGDITLDEKRVKIEVKSNQNYKSEWEDAAFRATYEHYDS